MATLLLTGATGLVGGETAFLLADRGRRVAAVVRARDGAAAAARLAERAARSGRPVPPAVTAIPGDILLPGLGLAAEAGAALGRTCETIVHCAAETCFTAGERLAATNVGGVANVIDFARSCPRLRRLIVVSSAPIITSPSGSTIGEDAPFAGYANGYVRSKREAETLALASGLPVVIVRPSIVISRGLPDRVFARGILWLLPLALDQGWMPLTGSERVDIVPVDFVAAAIAGLVGPGGRGGPGGRDPEFPRYHISAGEASSPTCAEIIDRLYAAGWAGGRLRFTGLNAGRGCFRAASLYLPFVAANVVYDNGRLLRHLGLPPTAVANFAHYAPEVMALITREEAIAESARP